MNEVYTITIYSAGRDESAETRAPVTCNVKPASGFLHFCDLVTNDSMSFRHEGICRRFEEIVDKWLKHDYPECTYDKRFPTIDDYLEWNKTVLTEDCDVTWYCCFTFYDSSVALLAETGMGGLPDELETLIRKIDALHKESALQRKKEKNYAAHFHRP